jgi:protein-S-isoprenylcysteine O-methyltransferase Ste14
MMAGGDAGFWSFAVVQIAVAALLLGIIFYAPGPWDLQRSIGTVLAIISMALLALSRYQLGKSFSVRPQAKALVTHGIYSRIRNPIYIFSALMAVGIFLIFHRPKLFFLFFILLPVQLLRARQESRVLDSRFGEQYRAYRRKTWF